MKKNARLSLFAVAQGVFIYRCPLCSIPILRLFYKKLLLIIFMLYTDYAIYILCYLQIIISLT